MIKPWTFIRYVLLASSLVTSSWSSGAEIPTRAPGPFPPDFPDSSGSSPRAADSLSHPLAAACGVGPTLATFAVLIKCSPNDCDRLFGPNVTGRLLRGAVRRLTPDAASSCLATMAKSAPSNMQVAGAVVVVSTAPYLCCYGASVPEGFVMSLKSTSRHALLSICRTDRGALSRCLARYRLHKDELLLARISFGGEPYVLVCSVPFPQGVDRSSPTHVRVLKEMQGAFWESFRRVWV